METVEGESNMQNRLYAARVPAIIAAVLVCGLLPASAGAKPPAKGLTVVPLKVEQGVTTQFAAKLADALEKAGETPGANVIAFGGDATDECDYDRCSERIGRMTRTSHLVRGTIRFTNLGGRVDLILETTAAKGGKTERIVDGYLTLTPKTDLDTLATALAEGLLLCVDNPMCPISTAAVWGKDGPPVKAATTPVPPVKKVTENAPATTSGDSRYPPDCDREGCLTTPDEPSGEIVEKAENDAPPPPPPDSGCGDDRASCRSGSATREVHEASPEAQMTSDGPGAKGSTDTITLQTRPDAPPVIIQVPDTPPFKSTEKAAVIGTRG